MSSFAAALLLLLAAVPASAASPVGRYRLVGEPDVASQLELRADGRFAYFLAAGALDEQAQGRWTSDGKVVRLTTEPEPKPAEFQVGPAGRTQATPLHVRVTSPDGRGIPLVDVTIGFDDGPPVTGYTQEDGWNLPAEEKRIPRWVELSVPIYFLKSRRYAIEAAVNDRAFILVANDLGTADFRGLTLPFHRGELLMQRHGSTLRYRVEE